MVEVVPHAEKPSALSLCAPPLALWDTLWERKTVKRGRTTCHDLDQGQETPVDYPQGTQRDTDFPTASGEEAFGLPCV